MYKVLLCWRYLRTRYIALASIISVMLGVATMIVVNAVMAGFTVEMQARLHGILSDVVFDAHSLEGFPDPEAHMAEIEKLVGNDLAGMTATCQVPAMLSFEYRGHWVTRPVQIVGVDEKSYRNVCDFSRYLQHPDNRSSLSFELRENGYDTRDHQAGEEARERRDMRHAGWEHRRRRAELDALWRSQSPGEGEGSGSGGSPPGADEEFDPFGGHPESEHVYDPAREQSTGVVVGISLASFRTSDGEDRFLVLPGDDVKLTFPTAGTPPKAVNSTFTVVDFYESKMSEYDSSLVFVPLARLQELRGMFDRETGTRYVTSIQMKLKDERRLDEVRDKLRAAFPPDVYSIDTWRDKQGALLAAVQVETSILNVLLFLIICVAGFGILAIFYMIVVEKTRDIGVLKSLGASAGGVMQIFLSYGITLGVVGSGVGLAIGLVFVRFINEIAGALAAVTGHEVFDPSIYYFYKIPTIVEPGTVGWIVAGAVLIAVLASILPARRAAQLHPVHALRFE
jgi:lipoprotein-releasing system permease protein